MFVRIDTTSIYVINKSVFDIAVAVVVVVWKKIVL